MGNTLYPDNPAMSEGLSDADVKIEFSALKEATSAAFEKRAKAFEAYRDTYDAANEAPYGSIRDGLLAEARRLRSEYNNAQNEYTHQKHLLEECEVRLTDAYKRRREYALDLSGISAEDRMNTKVAWWNKNVTHVYYGGLEAADGLGHGHVIIDDDEIIYHRKPFARHGSFNYT